MGRYRRRGKSTGGIAEGVVGLAMMIGALAVLNPVFKEQLLDTVRLIIAVLLVFGILGLVWYLLRQLKVSKVEPTLSVATRNYPSSGLSSHGDNFPPSFSSETFYPSTPENLAIQSLQPPTPDPHKLKWSVDVLQAIEWKRFELVTTEFLKITGYKAQETKIGADGGVDIRVTKSGNDTFHGIVQCKAWNTYKVGVKPVRELFGVMAAEKVATGMLITSGSFTSEAEEFAKGKMKLVSGASFVELIGKLPEEKQQRLLDIALEGDYRTPTCPQCDVKMTLRESKKGRNTGGQFWGCVRYPRCKQTLVYKPE
ncbi:MAG TPA: restriction endonuclease [Geobacteraceae bacterium]